MLHLFYKDLLFWMLYVNYWSRSDFRFYANVREATKIANTHPAVIIWDIFMASLIFPFLLHKKLKRMKLLMCDLYRNVINIYCNIPKMHLLNA